MTSSKSLTSSQSMTGVMRNEMLGEVGKHEGVLEPCGEEGRHYVSPVPQPPKNTGRGDERGRSRSGTRRWSAPCVTSSFVLVESLPDKRSQFVRNLRDDGNIEQGVVGWPLHVGVHHDCRVLKGDRLTPRTPFVSPLFGIVHLVEPVGGRGELSPVEDHPDREVWVVDVEVEGNAPHDNKACVHVLDLPTHGPARSSCCSALKKNFFLKIPEWIILTNVIRFCSFTPLKNVTSRADLKKFFLEQIRPRH